MRDTYEAGSADRRPRQGGRGSPSSNQRLDHLSDATGRGSAT